jgi:hypothetical protein
MATDNKQRWKTSLLTAFTQAAQTVAAESDQVSFFKHTKTHNLQLYPNQPSHQVPLIQRFLPLPIPPFHAIWQLSLLM